LLVTKIGSQKKCFKLNGYRHTHFQLKAIYVKNFLRISIRFFVTSAMALTYYEVRCDNHKSATNYSTLKEAQNWASKHTMETGHNTVITTKTKPD
jgi:uncharacterized membrane protein YfhO